MRPFSTLDSSPIPRRHEPNYCLIERMQVQDQFKVDLSDEEESGQSNSSGQARAAREQQRNALKGTGASNGHFGS
jgi:hypothetical protein